MNKDRLFVGAALAAAALVSAANADFSEGFEAPITWPTPPNTAGANVTLSSGVWFTKNQSQNAGTQAVFQGNSTVFSAQAGTATSYAAMNYNNGAGVATLNTWLITPELTLNNGDTFKFWTRTVNSPFFPDRLQLRMSTNGSSTNTGAGGTGVGDFSNLLVDINSGYSASGYPSVWTQYSVTVSGLGGATQGRFAFRYFVENGGPSGANSDYIGIDTVEYAAVPAPGAIALLAVGGLVGTRRRR